MDVSTREDMKSFWSLYSKDAGIEEMMLDTNASQLSPKEIPEILNLLPECKGKRILELAGGIGRFTGILAQQAGHVTTVDFIENFIEQNKEHNQSCDNIEYICDDVMNVNFEGERAIDHVQNIMSRGITHSVAYDKRPPKEQYSFDLVFSNWFLMYLSDNDVSAITQRILSWLKDGGYFFCRESCRKGVGNFNVKQNPTYYRSPEGYNSLLLQGLNNKHALWDFKLIRARNLQTYVKLKGNRNQICWLLKKRKQECGDEISINLMKSLENKLDSLNTISQMEEVIGKNYAAAVLGCNFVEDQFEMLNLQKGQNVLDIFCGTGREDFIMEEKYSAEVMGIDPSRGLIEYAWERKNGHHRDVKICFEIDDITKRDYPSQSFDVIYSRGRQSLKFTFQQPLLTKIMKWLKPGGKLLFYELCRGNSHDEDYTSNGDEQAEEDVQQCSPEDRLEILKSSGFTELKTGDVTQYLINTLTGIRVDLSEKKQDFQKIFTDEELKILDDDWGRMLKCLTDGKAKWSWFYAKKFSEN